MISGPFSFRTGLGLHSEFVHKRILAVVQTAAANGTAVFRKVLAGFADLQKVNDFFVGPGLHSGGNVAGHGLGVVGRLFYQGRWPGFLPGFARADGVDFGTVVCADFQTALFALEQIGADVFKFAKHYYSCIAISFPQLS